MKLWLLRPVGYSDGPCATGPAENDNPWEPWYDKAFGFVVAAENETSARQFAQANGGYETRGSRTPWLETRYSTCVELTAEGRTPGVIIEEFASS